MIVLLRIHVITYLIVSSFFKKNMLLFFDLIKNEKEILDSSFIILVIFIIRMYIENIVASIHINIMIYYEHVILTIYT